MHGRIVCEQNFSFRTVCLQGRQYFRPHCSGWDLQVSVRNVDGGQSSSYCSLLGESVHFFIFNCDVSCGCFIDAHNQVEEVLFFPNFLNIFIMTFVS